jgi:hypothetical protein
MSAVFAALRKMVSYRIPFLVIILVGLLASAALTVMAASPRVQMSGATYYVATNGNDSNPGTESQPWRTIQRAADTLVAGDTVYIRAGTYNEQVVPQNSGASGAYITYAAYPDETVTIDGAGLTLGSRDGLFQIYRQSYIKVVGLRVINAYGGGSTTGIRAEYASHIIIQGNYTYGTESSGIGIWYSDNIVVDRNEIEFANHGGYNENLSVSRSDQVEVMNNVVHHGFNCPNGGEGINVKDGASNVKVHHNIAHHLDKLCFGLDAWQNHTFNIEYYQNVAHDCYHGFIVSSERTGLAENIWVYNNIAYNNRFNGLTVVQWGGEPDGPKRDVYFINNTSYNNGYGFRINALNNENVVFRNNILASNGTNIAIASGAQAETTVDHNLFYDGNSGGDNAVIGDPLFVSVGTADFHLQANSPAIDAGSSLNAPNSDFDGISRPQGAGYDIGAYEYGGSPQLTPTATSTSTTLPTSTPTASSTSTPTFTSTSTSTPTASPTSTSTATSTSTPTVGPTSTPTATPTSTSTVVPTMTATPTPNPNEVILDDADAGFSTSFGQDSWEEYTQAGGRHYGGSHHYNHQVGTGQDIAMWSFAVPKPGRYEVYAWWWEASWRPTDVPYTIKHLSGSTTVRVNQQTNGGQWNLLGTFDFQGQGSVVVSDDASSGQDIVADAVTLAYLEPLPPAPPTSTATATPTSTPTIMPTMTATPTANPDEVVIDNKDDGFSPSFSQDAWVEYIQSGGRHYGGSHYYNRRIGTGEDIAVWSFTVPKPGRYKVYAWWWEGRWRPKDVPYTIDHLDGSTTVRVNQRIKGGRWNLLGAFDFLDQGSVAVSDDASSGYDVVADAVRVVYQRPLRPGGG